MNSSLLVVKKLNPLCFRQKDFCFCFCKRLEFFFFLAFFYGFLRNTDLRNYKYFCLFFLKRYATSFFFKELRKSVKKKLSFPPTFTRCFYFLKLFLRVFFFWNKFDSTFFFGFKCVCVLCFQGKTGFKRFRRFFKSIMRERSKRGNNMNWKRVKKLRTKEKTCLL